MALTKIVELSVLANSFRTNTKKGCNKLSNGELRLKHGPEGKGDFLINIWSDQSEKAIDSSSVRSSPGSPLLLLSPQILLGLFRLTALSLSSDSRFMSSMSRHNPWGRG